MTRKREPAGHHASGQEVAGVEFARRAPQIRSASQTTSRNFHVDAANGAERYGECVSDALGLANGEQARCPASL